MPRQLICPQGHHWEVTGPAPALCPVCGTPVPAAVASDVETLPPPPPPAATVAYPGSPTRQPHTDIVDAILADMPAVAGYEVLAELGRGGMGVVYKARHRKLNRLVALKMILGGGHAGEVGLTRFRHEAEAVAKLHHPNVVQIYEVGEQDGLPYFALEFCDGGSLEEKLHGTPLPPRAAAGLVETLARAMQAAHGEGIVHRDLKPANVLLSYPSPRPPPRSGEGEQAAPPFPPREGGLGGLGEATPKITDFGLAKQLDATQGHTATGAVLGTPSYMAPEQAGGQRKQVGPASDVYALGAILYECLTGRPPFRAATPLDTILQVVADEVVPPRRLQPKVPADLETICLKCLQKDGKKRYRTAAALAEDLRRFQAGEPITARPVGRIERGWRWCRRNPWVAGLSAALTLLLCALAVTSTLAAVRERGLREETDKARHEAEEKAEEARQRLVRLNTATGLHHLERGDYFGSLVWFAEALRQEKDPARAEVQRMRLTSIRRQSPRLLQAWAHDLPPHHVEFSPDGKRVLVACGGRNEGWSVGEGEALVWDAVRGGEAAPRVRHNGHVTHASFSPDGSTFVTTTGKIAGGAGEARVWDTVTTEPRTPPLYTKFQFEVLYAAFSPDGKRLVTAGGNLAGQPGVAQVWNVTTGKVLGPPLGHTHAHKVTHAAFSPDGSRFVTVSSPPVGSGVAQVWVATGPTFHPPLRHPAAVVQAWFNPVGDRVLTACADGAARLWDFRKGVEVGSPFRHRGAVHSARFSSDGTRIVTASADGTAQVWDVARGQPVGPPLSHKGPVRFAAFSPDGRRVVTAAGADLADEGAARVWDAATGEPLTPLLVHNGPVYHAAFRPDGRAVVTAGRDLVVRLWELPVRPATPRPEPGPAGERLVSLSADSRRAAVVLGNQVLVRDTLTSRPAGPPIRVDGTIEDVVLRGNNNLLICVRTGTSMHVSAWQWDVATGRRVGLPIPPPSEPPSPGLVPSADGRRVAGRTVGGKVCVWDAETRRLIGPPFGPAENTALTRTMLFFRGDGGAVVMVRRVNQQASEAQVWDTATGRSLSPLLRHDYLVEQVAFSRDGRRLVTASNYAPFGDPVGMGEGRVWDVASGRMQGLALQHRAAVTAVAFFPGDEGERVVTASKDGTARVWTTEGKPLTPPLRHDGPVYGARFSPDGRFVLTASVTAAGNPAARVWETSTGDPVTPLLLYRGGSANLVSFRPDGQAVLLPDLGPEGVRVQFCDLRPETRSAADWSRLAAVLSGRHIDAVGGFVPLDALDLRRAFDELKAGRR